MMTQLVYQVGGTLAQTAISYVERQADIDLFNNLQAGQFCYVFNARQMGKSSLLVRTAHRLRQEGYCRCALIDFSRIGSDDMRPQQWYSSFLVELVRSLGSPPALLAGLTINRPGEMPYLQQLTTFMEDSLLPYCRDHQVVIFLDEIDSLLHLPFPVDDFFAWIRSCYNQRAIQPSYQRLTFALFGVATPRDLMQDPRRTPFNLGVEITLQGLQRAEATPLLAGLTMLELTSGGAEALLDQVLWWTGGQPLLTQKLCWLISQQGQLPDALSVSDWMAELVQAQLIENWQTKDTPEHLRTIRDWVLADEHQASRLLGLYQQILTRGVPIDGSATQSMLLLSGLVVPWNGQLQVKNPIYQRIFSSAWVNDELAKLRPYAQAYAAWVRSERTDPHHLLQNLELQHALTWAQDKQLPDEDYRFLSASQTYAQQQIEQTLRLEQQARESVQKTLQMAERAHDCLNEARQKARQRPLPTPTWWLTAIGLTVAGLILTLRLSGLLQFVEWLALDFFFQHRIQSAIHQPITVIEITESDLRQLNGFPLSDAALAETLAHLQRARPALIGLDIYRDLPVEPGHDDLQNSLANNNNIVGIYKQIAPTIAPSAVMSPERLGFADQVVDSDGRVRRALLSIQSGQTIRYSFALQLALRYLQRDGILPASQPGYMQLGQARLRPFRADHGGYVRADSGGYQVFLNYHGPREQFQVFSLQDVLRERIPRAAIADRVVLLGYTAESANDFFQTPYGNQVFQPPLRMPGVILQANILAMLLAGAVDGRPFLRVWSPLLEQGWILLWVGAGALIGWRLQTLWRVVSVVMLGIGLLIGVAFVGFLLGWWFPWVPTALGFAIAALLFPSLTDRILFRHQLCQTVIYLHQGTAQQPILFSLGLTFLKQAEGRKHEGLIEAAAQRYQP